jgi:hypothetical protein
MGIGSFAHVAPTAVLRRLARAPAPAGAAVTSALTLVTAPAASGDHSPAQWASHVDACRLIGYARAR